jgi:5-methylcytosine-specific restriction endonuclease McrA
MNPKQKKSIKAQLIGIYGPYCWHCKCHFSAKDLTLDHLIPKSKGGSNRLENLWLACFPCNNSRGNKFCPPARSFRHLN